MDKLIAFALILVIGAGSGFVAYNIGQDAGLTQGKVEGFTIGYAEGEAQGMITGYDAGYDEGHDTGHKTGYSSGYTQGKNIGYLDGKREMTVYGQNKYQEGLNTGLSRGKVLGYDEGYGVGLDAGFTLTGYSIRDPTFAEMKTFLREDHTDGLEYTNLFDCENFAGQLKTNAFEKGYRCYFVLIECAESWHAINGFNVTGYGFVFIEPQSDRIMTVQIGTPYWDRDRYKNPGYDDTVLEILKIP